MRRRSGSRMLAAVLFTDIVDSTALASRLGDARWKELIARHHAIVRRELKRFGGKELDTAGDGFYASFTEPASAIRCACAASESVRELGIEIRTGVHFGECEQVGDKLGGMAVVVGARVMSLGGAGDVLLTASTSDLVAGAGLAFQDRGTHSLKGVDGRWHVLAVSEVDGAPRSRPAEPEEVEQRLGEIQPSAPRSRTWQVVATVAAFVVLAALVAVPLARRAGGSSEIAPNSIGIMDPDSGEVLSTLGLDTRPGSIAASADDVWVTNPDVGTVTRIDTNEQDDRDPIQVGENPTGIAVGGDVVWVVESGGPSVSRISTDTNFVEGDPIEVGNGPAGVAVGEGAVWVTNRFDGTISRIDQRSGEVGEPVPVGLDPRGIAIGFDSVWVGLAGSNTVVRINPATNEVTQPIPVGNAPGSLAVGGGAVWVVNTLDDTVSQINPDTNAVADVIPVGDGPSGIAVVGGAVWVANEGDGTLSRIEPGQASVRTIVIGSIPQGLADVGGDLWVSVRATATSHRGGTLQVVSGRPPLSFDLGGNYDPTAWSVLHLLGDGLLAFEPIGGSNPTLVPDLATSIPEPTDEGRTYAFQVRPGIQYSNGETVAPSDFRHAFERGFRLSGDYVGIYGGLVDGEACSKVAPKCDLGRGIATDDATGTITFHLVEPDPEFLYKLTLPFAYPVPPSVPNEEQVRAGVPGTGPYMLDGPRTDEGFALVRNPQFDFWSQAAQPDGYVDRIEWTFGVEAQAQVEAVDAGDADVAWDAYTVELDEFLVGSPAQVHTGPANATDFVVLNTQMPPFNDVDIRRAMNFAVDRDRVMQILHRGGNAIPTCQQLPPNFPGYEPYCPYTSDSGPEGVWTASDVKKAKKLVLRSGTKGMSVVFGYPPNSPDWAALADYMAELLIDLGYRGTAKPVSAEDWDRMFRGSPRTKFQMTVGNWYPDYPAASNFIAPFFACDGAASAGFCDPEIDAMIEEAIGAQAEDEVAAGALWTKVDRAIVDQAPYVWLDNPTFVDFVSERVENFQQHPQWGVLLNRLWVE